MKSILRLTFLFISLMITAFILFYFWASSSQLQESDYTKIVSFQNSKQSSSDTITIISYNIGYLSAMYNNLAIEIPKSVFESNLTDAIDSLSHYNPDIIAFQEIDFNSNRSYYVNQMDEIAKTLHIEYGAKAVNWDKRYLPFPYWPPTVQYGEMESGQAILSRFTIKKNQRIILQEVEGRPFWYKRFYLDRLLQIAELDINGKKLTIANVHLEAFQLQTRVAQSRQIVEAIRSLNNQNSLILIGDFNAISRKHLHSGTYDSEIMDRYKMDDTIDFIKSELGFSEAVPDSIEDLTDQFTFSTEKPSIHIDHIFFDERKIERIEWRLIRTMASDHFPILLRFTFIN